MRATKWRVVSGYKRRALCNTMRSRGVTSREDLVEFGCTNKDSGGHGEASFQWAGPGKILHAVVAWDARGELPSNQSTSFRCCERANQVRPRDGDPPRVETHPMHNSISQWSGNQWTTLTIQRAPEGEVPAKFNGNLILSAISGTGCDTPTVRQTHQGICATGKVQRISRRRKAAQHAGFEASQASFSWRTVGRFLR